MSGMQILNENGKMMMRLTMKKWVMLACAMIFGMAALTGCVAGNDLQNEYTAKAKQGDLEAMQQLSMMYFTANGVDHSDKKGAFWARKAADGGHKEAQSNVGEMYADGVVVRKNMVEALKWFILSSNQDFGPATRRMKDLEDVMTPQQIAQAEALAKVWKPQKIGSVTAPE